MRLLIGAVLAAAITAASPAGAQTKVTIGYGPGNPWMTAFVAKDKGIFAKHGIDATLQFIAVGSNQPAALMADAIQISGMNPSIVLFADEGGADIQVIAGANGQSKTGSTGGVLAREGSNIRLPADFTGKKVAVPGLNSALHIAFMKWLKDKGVDPNRTTYIETPINQMLDVMRNGQVDAAVAAAPFFDQIVNTKVGYRPADFLGDLADPFTIYSVWTMRKGYIAAHPEIVQGFRASIREAMEYIKANEAEARKTQITYLKLPEPVAMNVKLVEFTAEMTSAQMQWWIDACKELGLTKGTATVADVLAK